MHIFLLSALGITILTLLQTEGHSNEEQIIEVRNFNVKAKNKFQNAILPENPPNETISMAEKESDHHIELDRENKKLKITTQKFNLATASLSLNPTFIHTNLPRQSPQWLSRKMSTFAGSEKPKMNRINTVLSSDIDKKGKIEPKSCRRATESTTMSPTASPSSFRPSLTEMPSVSNGETFHPTNSWFVVGS